MFFDTYDTALAELEKRCGEFQNKVKARDKNAMVSITQISINEFELIVANGAGGRDNYLFAISLAQPPVQKFIISCSRVIA